ncbi:MAG: ABC-F family ATP-binding cassette domain-containing protein [Aminivibrio sp.]
MISIGNLRMYAGDRLLFKDLSWNINRGDRMGLIGANGAGKTTLLRVLTGEVTPDSGSVSMPGGIRVGYLPQDLIELPAMPVLEFLRSMAGVTGAEAKLAASASRLAEMTDQSEGYERELARHDYLLGRFESLDGYAFDALAEKVLSGLGFHPEDGCRCTTSFSGGWKMRIHLAGLLLTDPDVLLLDEPTNHLDTESMEWLEGWLAGFRGTIAAVSHDRRFLDRICTSIAELFMGTISVYSGNFSSYLEERERRLEELKRQEKRQREEVARMEEFIDRFRYKASKAAQVQSRVKQLGRMNLVEIEEDRRRVSFHFPPCPRSGLEVLKLEGGAKRYGSHTVFERASLTVRRGEKIALVGVNGAGKSTLSRVLSGTEKLSGGSLKIGHNVRVGFFSQQSHENLDYSKTVWESLSGRNPAWTAGEKRNLLGAFLFPGDDIHKPVSVLSGGEKSRLALLKLVMEDANCLVLDEPTNHLDMATRELFQRALLEYDGALVIVSHDRFFLDNLVTRVVEISSGKLYDYPGNYSYFMEKRRTPTPGGEVMADDGEKSDRERRREEAERRNLLYRQKRIILDRLEPLEEEIFRLEEEQEKRDLQLADPEVLSDRGRTQDLLILRSETAGELESLYSAWEDLTTEMENLESAG